MIVQQKIENEILVNHMIYESSDLSTSDQKITWLAVCSTCEFFNNNQCLKCNCVAETMMMLATAKCPINKW